VSIAPYTAVALQLTAQSLEAAADPRAQIMAQIAALEGKIMSARIFIEQYGGSPVKLAVLPEYLFTSYPGRISIPDFAARAGFADGGPEYEALGGVAQRLGLFIAGNAYETDRHFPDFYFQTCFIVAPSGDVILRYRRLLSMFAPSPHDVWDRYLDAYGADAVFPVVDTEIGRLAAIASEEILYPEIARCLAFKGAEVFAHSSSEIGSPLATAKDIAKQARAFENMAYVVSANTAGIAGSALPLMSADGNSQVVAPSGKLLAQANSGETFTAFAEIDIEALRRQRRQPAMLNSLARQRPGLFAPAYAAAADQYQQGGQMLGGGGQPQVPDREQFLAMQRAVIERLAKAGLI
jgi:predicted amidohydrolase